MSQPNRGGGHGWMRLLVLLVSFSGGVGCTTSLSPDSASETPADPSPTAAPSVSSPTPTETLGTGTSEPPTSNPYDVGPSFIGRLKLIIPVAGIQPHQLRDTFSDARSDNRTHDAIDIPAASGTPVLAAADGRIVKLFQGEPGGTTIYQSSTDEKLIFYYAHLQAYAAGLAEGTMVRQGEVIGYVGDSGNAGAGNYHLHFSIAIANDPKRYWEGTNINPYPLLSQQ